MGLPTGGTVTGARTERLDHIDREACFASLQRRAVMNLKRAGSVSSSDTGNTVMNRVTSECLQGIASGRLLRGGRIATWQDGPARATRCRVL
jgi:hypothetical protein